MDSQHALDLQDSSDSEQENIYDTGSINQYLAVPGPSNRRANPLSQRRATSSARSTSPAIPAPLSILPSQRTEDDPPNLYAQDYSAGQVDPQTPAVVMSTYSSSSADESVYSTPGPSQYRLVTPGTVTDARDLSQVSPGFVFENRAQLIQSLRSHRVNTVTELRRIERIFAAWASEDVTEPMTSAWNYYVHSNNFLSELRGLTRDYPFSSECLDEAKWAVQNDPQSVRSWNRCWLILVKIQNDHLIYKHARALASDREMWGDYQPTATDVEHLANKMIIAWNRAVVHLLRHWEGDPPSQWGH